MLGAPGAAFVVPNDRVGGSVAGWVAIIRVDAVDDPAHPYLLAHVLAEHERRKRVRIVIEPEPQLESVRRPPAVGARLVREVAPQVGGDDPRPRRAHGLAAPGGDLVRAFGEHLVEDLERSGSVAGVTERAEPLQHPLEHGVHVAPAGERVGVGLEALGLELAVHEPFDRAVGVRLERAGRQDPAVADVRERRL